MSVFYAYAHDAQNANDGRIILVFATKGVAEEWWREVSAHDWHVKRESSNHWDFMHNTKKCDLFEFFTAECFQPVAASFRGRMFLSLQNGDGAQPLFLLPASQTSVQNPSMDGTLTTPSAPRAGLPPPTSPTPVLPEGGGTPSTANMPFLAAIIFPDIPDIPNAPNVPIKYSKYIVKAKYQPSSDDSSTVTWSLLVNSDVDVPRFKSKGATHDPSTSQSSLRIFYNDVVDATGFNHFWGMIGAGHLHFITDKKVVVDGPIEGGPAVSVNFVGGGTWLSS